jgi:hypothetical protein
MPGIAKTSGSYLCYSSKKARFSWFLYVSPGKCRDRTSKYVTTHPSKSLPTHHPLSWWINKPKPWQMILPTVPFWTQKTVTYRKAHIIVAYIKATKWDNSSMVQKYGGKNKLFVWNLGGWKFSLHHCDQTDSRAHPSSYLMCTGGSLPGDKEDGAWSWQLASI